MKSSSDMNLKTNYLWEREYDRQYGSWLKILKGQNLYI